MPGATYEPCGRQNAYGHVVILYGLTEASPLMTATNTQDTLEVRATTVGRAIAGVEVKVIDTITGELLPRGEQGEILLSRPWSHAGLLAKSGSHK